MNAYIITYDNRPPRDYSALYRLMHSWGAVRLAQSVWLVQLAIDPFAAVRSVVGALEPDDTVAVLPLQQNAAWAAIHVSDAAANWLSRNIAQAIAA